VSPAKTIAACGLLILGAAGATALVFATEPSAARETATKRTPMLVSVTEVTRGTYRPVVQVTGTVVPVRELALRPRVTGQVVDRSEDLTPGGFVSEGQVLLRLDPSDYRNELVARRSAAQEAASALEVEEGRREVARREYALLGEPLPEEETGRVLREPQRAAATARLEAAQAAVRQARLDLARTTIRAPFDAHVLERRVDLGSQVSPSDVLARLVGTEAFWVIAEVPVDALGQIPVPGQMGRTVGSARGSSPSDRGEDGTEDPPDRKSRRAQASPGARAEVRLRTGWPEGAVRVGRVDRVVAELTPETRFARVFVRVPDPLGRGASASGEDDAAQPGLLLGAFVEVRIEGAPLADVVRLDRDHLRTDDTVWVMEDGVLRIREAEVAFRDDRYAYLRAGLDAGDRVVTTNLATVVDGAPLRLGDGPGGAS